MAWLDDCILLFGCILEVFLVYDYFRNFFELKVRKKYVGILMIATCFGIYGINMIGYANVNLFLFPLLMWIFVSLVFDSRLGTRIGYFISAYVVMIGVEFLYLILSRTTAEMVYEKGVVPVSDYGWQSIFVKFLNYILFLILKQTSHRSHSKMANKLFYTYLCVPVSTLGTMLAVFYSEVDFKSHVILRMVMTLFFVFMVLGNMVLFYAFQRHTEEMNQATVQQLELMHKNAEIERLTKITEMNDSYNETMHNMTHSLKVIEQLAVENNVDEIREIVEDLTGKLTQKEVYEYSSHKILNTILSEYKNKADRNKINFDIYVEPGCVLKNIKDIDFVSIIGNVLDNAFEAVSEIDEALIVFRMFMHEKGKMCIIKVVNDCKGNMIESNGKLQTTKKEKGIHGIGLSSISKNIERYQGSFSYYMEDKKFYAILILPIR